MPSVKPLAVVFFLLLTSPAFAETYAVDKNAWTCAGLPAITEVEELAKHGSKERLQHISDVAQCRKAAALQGTLTGEFPLTPPGDEIVNQPVTVMYAAGKYAFVCSQYMLCGESSPIFFCAYALVSDMRDSRGKSVTLEQLQKEAKGKTMADVPNTCPTCGECQK
jgi:hypothetical protein